MVETWSEEDFHRLEKRMMEEIATRLAALPPTCPGCGKRISSTNDFWPSRHCCKPCALIYCFLDKEDKW